MKELVKVQNQNVVTSSRTIAEEFDKDHDKVMRDINVLISHSPKLAGEFFAESKYRSRGKDYNEYVMNQDGFMLLVMGFNGKKAVVFKLEFIEAFKSMRLKLQSRNTARLENPAMTRALQDHRKEIGKDTKPFHYSNENNLVYLVVLGATAKKYREALDIDKDDSLRDSLTPLQIDAVEKIQKMNTTLIDLGFEYKDRKKQLNDFFNKRLSEPIRIEFSEING